MEVWMSLHRARLARGLDLDDVAAATRLSPAVVRKIDEGRFHELPSGLYARAYVRAFAAAVDLPPEETLRGLQPLLPREADPLPILRDMVEPSALERLRALGARCWAGTLASRPARRSAGATTYASLSMRCAIGTVDGLLVLGIDAVLVLLTAWSCGVTVEVLLDRAGTPVAVFCAVPLTIYFVLFGGVAGRTPGACFWEAANTLRHLQADGGGKARYTSLLPYSCQGDRIRSPHAPRSAGSGG
jgi:hypothetical protein